MGFIFPVSLLQMIQPLFVSGALYLLRSIPGSLFSLVLRDPEKTPAFFDALRVCKGPSLGNNFTMACPYTLLAHYDELDGVDGAGVSRWLVRVSVGLEGLNDLRERFDEALAAADSG